MLEEEGLSSEVIEALRCVTKLSDDESYDDFIDRVLTNQLAMRVKLHDLEDNMDLARLDELTDADIKRNQKYQKVCDRTTPAHINLHRWRPDCRANKNTQHHFFHLVPCRVLRLGQCLFQASGLFHWATLALTCRYVRRLPQTKAFHWGMGEYIRFGGLIFLKGAELIFVFLNRQMRLIGIIY